ncbi:hypothetical protein TDB9533_00557 [Thalassocella blandensis]|nr:hypothetical protein TDB9533_00557 [Thalassocella blandensis]
MTDFKDLVAAQTVNAMTADIKSFLLSPNGIRTRSQQIYQRALDGATHFAIEEEKIAEVTDYVLAVIEENYPDKNVPYHSRWRHFEVGNQAQLQAFNALINDMNALEKARLGLDLILPSVLVDAGAGPDWQYTSVNSKTVGRSEGLGLASMDMFLAGYLSHEGKAATTAPGLRAMTVEQFAQAFKVTEKNPLLGVEGRVELLRSLGLAMQAQPKIFPHQRPGDLVDYILQQYRTKPTAENILHVVLTCFGDIWPGRLNFTGTNLGDTWAYSPFGQAPSAYIPFHKLSQWISYSIIETLSNSGIEVSGVEALTGLAEYRNGGLMLDSGLIRLRNEADAEQEWSPASDIIIEWRALTICLLDKIAEHIVTKLKTTPEKFPLAKVLEGGTWAAGRKLALEKRNNLTPPLQILSDATVF